MSLPPARPLHQMNADQGSAVGGVKAMLSRIQEQYRDSHVQLPDGSVPRVSKGVGKPASFGGKKPKDDPQPQKGDSAEVAVSTGATGVKAKLAEINSKFANSFVKLPDGTVPTSVAPVKKATVEPKTEEKPFGSGIRNIHHQERSAQDAVQMPAKGKGSDSAAYSDYPEGAATASSSGVVYSDYESFQGTSDAKQNFVAKKTAPQDASSRPNSSSWAPPPHSPGLPMSAILHPPPPLLDRNKSASKTGQRNDESASKRFENSSPQRSQEDSARNSGMVYSMKTLSNAAGSKTVASNSLAAQAMNNSASRAPTYGIGVSFKPDDQGYLQVVKLIPGGPGAESGRIHVGDKLRFINDVDVTHVALDRFPELISGPIGSTVRLSLLRHAEGAREYVVEVTVARGPCEKSVGSLGSSPRVLVPKVIAVNPVPVVASDLSAVPANSHMPVHPPAHNQVMNSNGGRFPRPGGNSIEQQPQSHPPSPLKAARERAMPSSQDSSVHTTGSHPPARQESIPIPEPQPQRSVANKRVGVGIIFQNDDAGGLKVKRLVPGSPAETSGAVIAGDTLIEINGRSVYGKSVAEIQEQILGPENSNVTLGFRRLSGASMSVHRVQLTRAWEQPQQEVVLLPSGSSIASPSKILDMLFLGDEAVSRNREALRREGITCIINAAKECACPFEREFAYTHMQFEDSSTENIRKGFDQVSAIISRNMLQGLSSLVHCSSSLSRSVALCIAFLMKEKKATLRQAFHLVKGAKPSMKLNHGFYLQLMDYEKDLFGVNSMSAMTEDEYIRTLQGPA